MDLYKAIRSLYDEKKRLDRLIESIERLKTVGASPPPAKPRGRRGRRRMTAEERREVSARMKRYWDSRRGQDAVAAVAGADGVVSPARPPGISPDSVP